MGSKISRRATIAGMIVGFFLLGGIIAYALTTLFATGNTYPADVSPKDFFEIADVNPFGGHVELAPGESMNINPEVTSNATVDMYVFMKMVMPKCSLGGLYEINTDWLLVDTYEQDGQWVEVYGYNGVLTPGQSTGQMADKATMKEIGLEEYVSFTNIQFSMTAYACGTDNEAFEDAWGDIRTATGA